MSRLPAPSRRTRPTRGGRRIAESSSSTTRSRPGNESGRRRLAGSAREGSQPSSGSPRARLRVVCCCAYWLPTVTGGLVAILVKLLFGTTGTRTSPEWLACLPSTSWSSPGADVDILQVAGIRRRAQCKPQPVRTSAQPIGQGHSHRRAGRGGAGIHSHRRRVRIRTRDGHDGASRGSNRAVVQEETGTRYCPESWASSQSTFSWSLRLPRRRTADSWCWPTKRRPVPANRLLRQERWSRSPSREEPGVAVVELTRQLRRIRVGCDGDRRTRRRAEDTSLFRNSRNS